MLFMPVISICQNFNIKGIILGANSEKLEYANLVLKGDSIKIIKSATTDEEGKFMMEGLQKGKYIFQIYILGYKNYRREIEIIKNIDFGDIKLEKEEEILDEIELSTRVPLVQNIGDRLVVNVSDNIFAKGRRADQFLNYTPFITANEQDGITLMNGTPIVLINDRRVYMDSKEVLDFLKSIPAEAISSIEIYTNPPARFDAEGTAGVININISKQALMGIKGSVTGWINSLRENMGGKKGILQSAVLNGSISYRDEKWYVSSMLGYGRYFTPNLNISNVIFLEKNNGFNSNNDYQADNTGKNFQFSIGRDIRKNHSIILNYRYRNSLNNDGSNYINNEFNSNKDIIKVTRGNVNVSDNINSHTAGINYNWDKGKGEKLMILGDYYGTDRNRNQDIINKYFIHSVDTAYNENKLYINLPISSNIFAAQVDYTLPIETIGNFSFGGKYTLSSIESRTDYYDVINKDKIKNNLNSVDFSYIENISAIYGSYGIGGLKIGLRYEYTSAKYNDKKHSKLEDRIYGGFFPSISYTQSLFEKRDAVTLSYNRRLNRPKYSDFNGLFYMSENELVVGYPEIRPSFPNKIQCTYNLMKKYIIIGEFIYTSDDINQVYYQTNNNSMINQKRNIDNYYSYSLSANINQPIYDWWSINLNGRINYNKMLGQFISSNQELIKISDEGIYSGLALISIFNFFGYNIELISDYIPEGKIGYKKIHERYRIDLSVVKNFLNNKLSVTMYFADLFKTNIFRSTSYIGNTVSYYRKEAVPMAAISITYNFEYGKKDLKEMKSKNSIEEEMQRLN